MFPDLSLSAMAWITGAILVIYLGVITYALLGPRKQRHPEDGSRCPERATSGKWDPRPGAREPDLVAEVRQAHRLHGLDGQLRPQ